ncbi:MAG: acylphosphatase [Phycisphaerales bacterium]|nr:acylphosphatase [Phycisphaerales bacterium]
MTTGDAGRVRVRVVYSGRVQGVGFRASAVELSRRSAVVGFVRNLPDGTVELEAEGTERHVEDFLAAVQRQMGGFIGRSTRTDVTPLGEERRFEVKY